MAGEIGRRRRRLFDGTRGMGFVWNITGQENCENRSLAEVLEQKT